MGDGSVRQGGNTPGISSGALLREAMILAIWAETSHRQMLDGLEVMERKSAHALVRQELIRVVERNSATSMLWFCDE